MKYTKIVILFCIIVLAYGVGVFTGIQLPTPHSEFKTLKQAANRLYVRDTCGTWHLIEFYNDTFYVDGRKAEK